MTIELTSQSMEKAELAQKLCDFGIAFFSIHRLELDPDTNNQLLSGLAYAFIEDTFEEVDEEPATTAEPRYEIIIKSDGRRSGIFNDPFSTYEDALNELDCGYRDKKESWTNVYEIRGIDNV